jgi:uncharacterized membrane protein YheB (UPF0754 family)
MTKNNTFVVLTDGYYFKLMYYTDKSNTLLTYRNADFEHSSELTYKLITRMKDAPDADISSYSIKEIVELLTRQYEEKLFNQLVLIAPEEVMTKLELALPDPIKKLVKNKVIGDYLHLSQDKLENDLASLVTG